MANNTQAQRDGSMQQFPELWGSSRVSKRMTITAAAEVKAEFQLPGLSLSDQGTSAILKDSTDQEGLQFSTPTWLKNTVVRQQEQVTRSQEGYGGCASCRFQMCICTDLSRSSSSSLPNHLHKEWLSGPGSSSIATDPPRGCLGPPMENDRDNGKNDPCLVRPSPSYNAGIGEDYEVCKTFATEVNLEEARMKFKVMNHPLFEEMFASHVRCLCTITPVDQQYKIDEQLSRSHEVRAKYSGFAIEDDEQFNHELDFVMKDYSLQLSNLQGELRNHVRVHAVDAMKSCKEIEIQLFNMTGVERREGNGATMSDDDEDVSKELSSFGARMQTDILDISTLGYGPLVPSQTERQILERVREELKHDLGENGYRNKLIEVREEILRKRRAGKLPEGTTTILKSWWEAHSRWPYPTEDEKERLIQETGLELKQVNNWFINQRKRNWHSNPLSPSSYPRNKRKTS